MFSECVENLRENRHVFCQRLNRPISNLICNPGIDAMTPYDLAGYFRQFSLWTVVFLLMGVFIYSFEFEYICPEKRYELERDVWDRSSHEWHQEFPSYAEWIDRDQRALDRINDALHIDHSCLNQEGYQAYYDCHFGPNESPDTRDRQ